VCYRAREPIPTRGAMKSFPAFGPIAQLDAVLNSLPWLVFVCYHAQEPIPTRVAMKDFPAVGPIAQPAAGLNSLVACLRVLPRAGANPHA